MSQFGGMQTIQIWTFNCEYIASDPAAVKEGLKPDIDAVLNSRALDIPGNVSFLTFVNT